MKNHLFLILIFFIACHLQAQQPEKKISLELNKNMAVHFASLALKCVNKQFPNKPGHVIQGVDDLQLPAQMHPAFYGCFDWHSSVHGHWMLVRLLKLFPEMELATEIRQALNNNLTKENLHEEAAYFGRKGTRTFERTYGWAWLLKLAEELHEWDDPDGVVWRQNLAPLEQAIVARYFDFLPNLDYPNRTGEHPNTAFGIAFAWDYAVMTGNDSLRSLIEVRARDYYLQDQFCPASWEPGGTDFLSPCLEEADLMRRVLPVDEFRQWLRYFLPGLEEGKPRSLCKPVKVSDRSDPKIVHLDGLNLSRAWCFFGIRNTLYAPDDNGTIIEQAAIAHLKAALPYISSGEYGGEHWLGSFAVYALSIKDRHGH